MSSNERDKTPFFTIITPSFNQGRFIRRTIESVISQNFDSLEYLIFDGGSSDETVSILKTFGDAIHWISEPDRGQTHAVNKGLRVAKGQVIGWLNSDDIYYQGALQIVHDVFIKHPEIETLYGMADHIDENDTIIEPYYNEDWDYDRLKEICYICQPAVFFRKSIVDQFGILDENLKYCMDYEYWLRIGKEKPFYYLKQRIAGSRFYKNTKTLSSAVEVHLEILKMFKENFGNIPDRWILAHAHAVARSLGLKRGNPEEELRFVVKLISVSISDYLRLKHYIPISLLRVVSHWFITAAKNRIKHKG
jgi:glycosyltransferase involved in cell wall biosynthesis